jgi:aspartate racemase
MDDWMETLWYPDIEYSNKETRMKTIGLLGGMSWESSLEYYRLLNQMVRQRLGGMHSARCILYSLDFAEIEDLQMRDEWEQAAEILIKAAQGLGRAGADCLLICTNTMHKLAEQVQANIQIPLLHIADATGEAVLAQGLQTVALLGTRFTMEEDFYRGRLEDKFNLQVLIPSANDRQVVHDVIYDELVQGTINPASRQAYLTIIDRLVEQGTQGIILGCTEIGLLVKPEHTQTPLFDTTLIHVQTAVEWALDEGS